MTKKSFNKRLVLETKTKKKIRKKKHTKTSSDKDLDINMASSNTVPTCLTSAHKEINNSNSNADATTPTNAPKETLDNSIHPSINQKTTTQQTMINHMKIKRIYSS